MASEFARISSAVGKEGKINQRATPGLGVRPLGGVPRFGQRPDRRPGAAFHGSRARHRRGGQGRPLADHGARSGRPLAQGRVPAHRARGEHHGGAVEFLRLRSDARGARGRHRRQAGRPGRGEGRRRRVEGPDRQRQLHGRQPDGSGPQHRRGDHRRGQRRSLPQDHGGCAGRNSGAQEHHQHHGGSARLVRLRSDARGARSRNRRQTRRPGGSEGRRGRLEGSDGQRQFHGRQPDGPGPQHRRSDHGGGQRRSLPQNHGGRARRNSGAEEHHQHDGGPAQRLRLRSDARGARSRHRRQSGRPGGCARRGRHLEGSDRLRELHGRQPDRPGAQHRRSDHRRGQRRSLAQDHGGRARRNSGAEEHHQHDGGPAQLVRLRSDARGARSGYRRQARRPGGGEGRRRHLEGS